MVLSDGTIKRYVDDGVIRIDPYEEEHVEPASVDLRLSESFAKIKSTGIIDTRDPTSVEYREFHTDNLVLNPGDTILGSTIGRSSLGRIFVEVHKTAGFGDPGFEGDITLEIGNDGCNPVKLYAGQRICQIIFEELDQPAERPYGHDGSQYQSQQGATSSGMNFD